MAARQDERLWEPRWTVSDRVAGAADSTKETCSGLRSWDGSLGRCAALTFAGAAARATEKYC